MLDSGGFVYINPDMFPQVLAQDIDPAEVKVLATAQKPYNQSILTEKSGPPAWKQHPTWYGVSENDRIVPPDAQHMFAKQINATVLSINSSHASPLSHPNEVAQLILNAKCNKGRKGQSYDQLINQLIEKKKVNSVDRRIESYQSTESDHT